MKIKYSSFLLFFCLVHISSLRLKAQTNYVPNFDFSDGSGTPKCVYSYCYGGPGDIETDIYYWRNALVHSNCKRSCQFPFVRKCPTADWMDRILCAETNGIPYTNSIRFANVITGTTDGYREGIGVRLPFKLIAGKYVVRFKVAVREEDSGENMQLSTHLTKWEEGWNARKKGNVRMKYINVFNMGGKSSRWHVVLAQFEVSQNKSGEMDILTLVRDITTDDVADNKFFIDQVELYHYCPPSILFQNRHFDMLDDFPYEAEIIKAGRDYLNWWPVGDVVVEDTMSMVKFKASKEVILKPGFIVERGGFFRAWIAPCTLPCPFPLADPGKDTTVCGSGCINLGGPDRYGITNEWTSEPEGAVQYLSSITAPNPTFCPPVGAGRIRYKVKATNQCNQSWTDEVIVDYDRNPDPNPSFTLSNLNLSDSLSFDLSVSSHTETIKVEIMTCSNVVLQTYEFDNGDEFNCCLFNFKVDRFFPSCYCYKVRVAAKNYCYNNWKDTIFSWPRNIAYNFISYSNFACKNLVYDWAGYLNMVVHGAASFSIKVYDLDNREKHSYSDICVTDTIALWHPPSNLEAGSYYVNLHVYDCYNQDHFYTYQVVVFDHCQAKKAMDEIWVRPSTTNNLQSTTFYINLYPNPSNGIVKVEGYIGKSDEKVRAVISDMVGQFKREFNLTGEHSGALYEQMDLSGLETGIYFVSLEYGSFVMVKRISVIK